VIGGRTTTVGSCVLIAGTGYSRLVLEEVTVCEEGGDKGTSNLGGFVMTGIKGMSVTVAI